jgi:hypothetical protein
LLNKKRTKFHSFLYFRNHLKDSIVAVGKLESRLG